MALTCKIRIFKTLTKRLYFKLKNLGHVVMSLKLNQWQNEGCIIQQVFNLSCSIIWSFLPSLVYRLSNMTEMQATVICNFFFKKNVHNLVTDFMVFLDLFTRKKIH